MSSKTSSSGATCVAATTPTSSWTRPNPSCRGHPGARRGAARQPDYGGALTGSVPPPPPPVVGGGAVVGGAVVGGGSVVGGATVVGGSVTESAGGADVVVELDVVLTGPVVVVRSVP